MLKNKKNKQSNDTEQEKESNRKVTANPFVGISGKIKVDVLILIRENTDRN